MMRFSLILFSAAMLFSCSTNSSSESITLKVNEEGKIRKTDDEWKKILPKSTYLVTRENGTERPYTGKLLNNHETGTYTCYSCGLPLFSSEAKFESNTGWPSFYRVINRKNVIEKAESDGRTEVICARCDAHLGHVFNDGSRPTGLRYCMNSVAMKLVKKN